MIRLNVRKDGKVEVKSFIQKNDLISYLDKDLDLHNIICNFPNHSVFELADNIWDLNVGTALTHGNYTFAMAGKSRAGNIMLGGE